MGKVGKKTKNLSSEERTIISEIEKMIENKELSDNYPSFMIESTHPDIYSLRRKLIKYMGFVLISKDWVKDLSQWIGKRKCLELMAGTGSLTYSLKMEGINIRGTDNYSWKRDTNGQDRSLWNENQMWTCLENLDAEESLEKYGRDVEIVIMSWPPYNDEIAVRVLRKMRQVNPSCLMIYIGEEKGGWKMAMIYAMSDIHGYYDLMVENLKLIDLEDKENKLIFCGDYIDGTVEESGSIPLLIYDSLKDEYIY